MARQGLRARLAFVFAAVVVSSCDCDVFPLHGLDGVIVGLVCDETGGDPAGARAVRFTPRAGAALHAVTDATGAFRMERVPPGTGTLEIAVPAGGGARPHVLHVEPGVTTIFTDTSCRDHNAPGTGSISGIICNRHSGDLVRDAEVSVPLADGSVLTTRTDDDGAFALERVPIGEQMVVVQADGFQRTWLVTVVEGETAVLDVGDDCNRQTAENGLVRGFLCDPSAPDASGAPLAGARVTTTDGVGDDFSDLTDVDGTFLLGPMAPGPIEIRVVRAPDVELAFGATVVAGREITASVAQQCALPSGPPGSVEGRVCAPDGATWLADATVWIELADGTRIEATTDDGGRFRLDGVPTGDQIVHIERGSFTATIPVVVTSDGVVVIPEEECAIGTDLKIAVVDGYWDDVYSVLINVGIDASIIDRYSVGWAATLVGDYALLASYDIVLVNCGAQESAFLGDPVFAANVAQYVEAGGSLYVSDEAYDVVERAFPSTIEFFGDDLVASSAERGEMTGVQPATIVDAALASSMLQTTIELHYPYGAWAVMQGVAPDVRIYIRGDANVRNIAGSLETIGDVPHTVGFSAGQGKVIYTSFHQEPGLNLDAQRVLQLLVFEL